MKMYKQREQTTAWESFKGLDLLKEAKGWHGRKLKKGRDDEGPRRANLRKYQKRSNKNEIGYDRSDIRGKLRRGEETDEGTWDGRTWAEDSGQSAEGSVKDMAHCQRAKGL